MQDKLKDDLVREIDRSKLNNSLNTSKQLDDNHTNVALSEENKYLREEIDRLNRFQQTDDLQEEVIELRKIIINLERENMRLKESSTKPKGDKRDLMLTSSSHRLIDAPRERPNVDILSTTKSNIPLTNSNLFSSDIPHLTEGNNAQEYRANVEALSRELENENSKLRRLLNDRGRAMLEKEKYLRDVVNQNRALQQEGELKKKELILLNTIESYL